MRIVFTIFILLFVVQASSAQTAPTGEIAYSGNRTESTHIYVFNLDTGAERQITFSEGSDVTPVWSQDGSAILVNRRSGTNTLVAVDPQGRGELVVAEIDMFTPSWSPDRKNAVFMYQGEIQTIRLDGANLTQLTDNDLFNYVPSWSPDGEQIAYISQDSAMFSTEQAETIYIIDVDGSNSREVVAMTGDVGGLKWSPDGTQLAFSVIANDGAAVYIVNADGTDLTRITGEDYHGMAPTWSPDGDWIAFQYRSFSDVPGVNCQSGDRLYVIGVDGSNLQQITSESACFPTWNPAG